MSAFNALKLGLSLCHVILNTHSIIDTIIPSQPNTKNFLIFHNVQVSVSEFDHSPSDASRRFYVNLEGPLTLSALQIVTLDAHLVVYLVTLSTTVGLWVQVVLEVTSCAEVVHTFYAVLIKH
jgi:hypothetical protein